MRPAGHPDCLVAINGPEDGTEFLITRMPLHVGRDPQAGLNLRLDADVQSHHARITVVSDGYRVRSVDGAPVFVNGRQAGTIRSRILHAGEQVQFGNTILMLECAPDGLARKSHGIVTESDFAWALHRFFASASETGHRTWRILVALLGGLLRHWVLVLFLTGLGVFWSNDALRARASNILDWVRYFIQNRLGG